MSKTNIQVVCNLNEKKWLNKDEAIAYMSFGSKDTLQKLRDTNKLPFAKLGRSIVYRRTDIDNLLEDHMIFPHQLP